MLSMTGFGERNGTRHLDGNIQKTVIDRFDLQRDLPVIGTVLLPAVARHAHHGQIPPFNLMIIPQTARA